MLYPPGLQGGAASGVGGKVSVFVARWHVGTVLVGELVGVMVSDWDELFHCVVVLCLLLLL